MNGIYTPVKVTTGISDGVNIEIKSGIDEGETVRGPRVIDDADDDLGTKHPAVAEQEAKAQ